MKLGFLGPRGTFSYEAAKIYNENCELIEYRTISEAILGLLNNKIDELIVPIENSIQGGVTETIDFLIKNDGVFVNKEIILKIKQNLLANKKYKLEEIKQIYSHPQAIAQSKKFIDENIKEVEICGVSSTALAAKEIKEKDYAACIANESCAVEYGLEILAEGIQENNLNKTKFWVLSKNKKNEGNKMAVIFSCKDEPGALYKVLGHFYKNDVNLLKIESRPAKTELGSYIFLVELEFNNSTSNSLEALKNECKFVKILGRF